MTVEADIERHEKRIIKLEDCVDILSKGLASIEGKTGNTEMLIKWVILPLLVIVGGLVGIKLVLP